MTTTTTLRIEVPKWAEDIGAEGKPLRERFDAHYANLDAEELKKLNHLERQLGIWLMEQLNKMPF